MGIVEKLKRLHKQTLLKLKDIKRVAIADEAGVGNEEYLNRVRTLDSYINPNSTDSGDSQSTDANILSETAQSNVSAKTKSAKKSTKMFNM